MKDELEKSFAFILELEKLKRDELFGKQVWKIYTRRLNGLRRSGIIESQIKF